MIYNLHYEKENMSLRFSIWGEPTIRFLYLNEKKVMDFFTRQIF